MPIESLWTLVVSLVVLAFGVTLRAAFLSESLKEADRKLAVFFTKLETLQKAHDEAISNISQLQKAEIEKLNNAYSNSVRKTVDESFERSHRLALINALRSKP